MSSRNCSGCDIHPCVGCRGTLVVFDFSPGGQVMKCPDCAADDWRAWKNGPCGTGMRVAVGVLG